MRGTGGYRALFARLAGRRATADDDAFELTPEAERLRSAMEMQEFGVALYRQRMRRENPDATEAKIDALVRSWLIAPPRPDRIRLMPRKRGHGYAG